MKQLRLTESDLSAFKARQESRGAPLSLTDAVTVAHLAGRGGGEALIRELQGKLPLEAAANTAERNPTAVTAVHPAVEPMRFVDLILPYPISANRYWRTAVIKGSARTYVSAEAKSYRAIVARAAIDAGVMRPIEGRVSVEYWLYPNRPKDWERRQRKAPDSWDDTVACIDLDNAQKVLFDSLKGVVIVDDKWVRRITSERMEPDDGGARVVVRVGGV